MRHRTSRGRGAGHGECRAPGSNRGTAMLEKLPDAIGHALSGQRAGGLPPDPPPGHGVHRYAFEVFALGPGASFLHTPGRDEVLEVLDAHALASGCLIGTYVRPDGSIPEARDEVVAPLATPPAA